MSRLLFALCEVARNFAVVLDALLAPSPRYGELLLYFLAEMI